MIEKLTDGLLRFFNILITVYDEVNPNIPEEFHRCFNKARCKHSRMSEKREQKHSTHAVANFLDTCFLHIFHPVGVEKIIFFNFKDKTFFRQTFILLSYDTLPLYLSTSFHLITVKAFDTFHDKLN